MRVCLRLFNVIVLFIIVAFIRAG